jgi:ribonuclease HI
MIDMPDKLPSDATTVGISRIQNGLHVFADGCYDPNSGQGGWAFIAYRDGVEIASDFGGVPDAASNSMELFALLRAAMWVSSNAAGEPAVIWSDSNYSVDGCNRLRHIWKTNGWKKVDPSPKTRKRTIADPELWQEIDLQLSQNQSLSIAWCKGHSGNVGNERADELAEIGRLSDGHSRKNARG